MSSQKIFPAPTKNKKLQIFISSTYKDLLPERQAAVSAILKAGHIPAGMELFTAGDESQLEVIRHWINESDVLMLILGSRYGTIEPKSLKSYTEIEYHYAKELGKPTFAIIMDDGCFDDNWKKFQDEHEIENRTKYDEFKTFVKSNMCSFFTDPKDIKIAIYESLNVIANKYDLQGWISGASVKSIVQISAEKEILNSEIKKLQTEIQVLRDQNNDQRLMQKQDTYNGFSFQELRDILVKTRINLPDENGKKNEKTVSLLNAFLIFPTTLGGAVTNAHGISETESWFFFSVASPLLKYGLIRQDKVPVKVRWSKLTISDLGLKFLAELERRKAKADSSKSDKK